MVNPLNGLPIQSPPQQVHQRCSHHRVSVFQGPSPQVGEERLNCLRFSSSNSASLPDNHHHSWQHPQRRQRWRFQWLIFPLVSSDSSSHLCMPPYSRQVCESTQHLSDVFLNPCFVKKHTNFCRSWRNCPKGPRSDVLRRVLSHHFSDCSVPCEKRITEIVPHMFWHVRKRVSQGHLVWEQLMNECLRVISCLEVVWVIEPELPRCTHHNFNWIQ